MAEKLTVIREASKVLELIEYLRDKDFVAYDTETTGLEKGSTIIGLSVAADVEEGYYVILHAWNVETQKLDALETNEYVRPLLEMIKSKQLIMHNAIFDCAMTNWVYGVDLMPSVHTDTMILAHLLDENRAIGLKDLAVSIYGEDSKKEQEDMKASISKNGGSLTKANYELYKADADLIGLYGAKDAILTLKLFYTLAPDLFDQGLDAFFYEEECMPLLRGPTYDLNTTGLRVDGDKLAELKRSLIADCAESRAFIEKEIADHVKDYPGLKRGKFNVDSTAQRSWLLYIKLGNPFHVLTDEGRALCKALGLGLPYAHAAQREFLRVVTANKDRVWEEAKFNAKTKKLGRPKKVRDPWYYIASGRASLEKVANKYKWVERYLKYAKDVKILSTYVEGIEAKAKYGIIRPSFKQAGTTSGRYSSQNPNFQNLPRDDKRVKSCIVARPGKVFVGADHSQLEPRTFASLSGDPKLIACFADGDDFYSVIGTEVFDKYDCSLKKEAPDAFAVKYPKLRNISKVVSLSSTYGTTAFKMAPTIGKTVEEAEEVIKNYFDKFPGVKKFMLNCHKEAMESGVVKNLYGRPRRMPKALNIRKIYGNRPHSDLPYEARNMLNLAVNHRVQSTAASIMNRGAILCWEMLKEIPEAKIVLQVHDELILEVPEAHASRAAEILKQAMETAVTLPDVALVAEPKIANNLADLK